MSVERETWAEIEDYGRAHFHGDEQRDWLAAARSAYIAGDVQALAELLLDNADDGLDGL